MNSFFEFLNEIREEELLTEGLTLLQVEALLFLAFKAGYEEGIEDRDA